jgi:phosphate transport system protein
MSVHLQRQIEKLKEHIAQLGARVEQSLLLAMVCIERRDARLAEQVIAEDETIDRLELDIEEECLHTLALYQPVAADLRFVVAVLKINNDLERIADMAGNIAQQGKFLAAEPPLESLPYDLSGMADRVRDMLGRALRAMLQTDVDLAQSVRQSDDEVDAAHRRMYETVEEAMRRHPDRVPTLIHYMNISRQLERIADLAVNIAEDVIYTVQGRLVRHTH